MTIGILRRLFQILSLLGALALVLALPRALAPAAVPEGGHGRVDTSATALPVAQAVPVSAPAPALAQLVPTARAWRTAWAALATTGVVVLPAALLALLAGSLVGSWAARTNAPALRSALAVLGAVALAIPVFLVARIAAALAGPMPDALLAAAGRADPAGWLSAFATPVPFACIVVLAIAVAPGIATRAPHRGHRTRRSRAGGAPAARVRGGERDRVAGCWPSARGEQDGGRPEGHERVPRRARGQCRARASLHGVRCAPARSASAGGWLKCRRRSPGA